MSGKLLEEATVKSSCWLLSVLRNQDGEFER